jgi:hypothetical protein
MHSVKFPLAMIPAKPGWRAVFDNGSILPVIGWALVVERVQREAYDGLVGSLEFDSDDEVNDGGRDFEAVVVEGGWIHLADNPSALLAPGLDPDGP